MSNSEVFNFCKKGTSFSYNLNVPFYSATDGDKTLISDLTKYILSLEENIINHEGLVSEVPKNNKDPYQHTQQWKQHNLIKDDIGLDGEHLKRFPSDPVQEKLFQIIRSNYLRFLAEMRLPRIKCYVHCWANVLREDQWISKHAHITAEDAYLAGTYYLTTNDTVLVLEDPIEGKPKLEVKTAERKLIMFPSWVPHYSLKDESGQMRISIAFDVVLEKTMLGNPWRPHVLLDDPTTMSGL